MTLCLLLTLSALLPLARAATRPALAPGWVIDQWGTADGLPVDHAESVVPLPDGTVWVATFGGLARFDGLRFHTLGPHQIPGLRNTRQAALARHPVDGAIWCLGDEQRSLLRIGPDGTIALWSDIGGEPSISGPGRLRVDREGLWLSTARGLYALTDQPTLRFAGQTGPVLDTLLDPQGRRWIATTHRGLLEVQAGERLVRARLPGQDDAVLSNARLLTDGRIFVASEQRLLSWQGPGHEMEPAGPRLEPEACAVGLLDEALCERSAGPNGVWFVNRGEVLYADGPGHPARAQAARVATFPSRIHEATVDAAGDLWLTTRGEGLVRVRRAPIQVRDSAPADPQAQALFLDPQGALWIRGDQRWWRTAAAGSAAPPEPLVLQRDGAPMNANHTLGYPFVEDGQWWMVLASQLHRITPEAAGWTATLASPVVFGEVRATLVDRQGRRWLGGTTGLWRQEAGDWVLAASASGDRLAGVRAFAELPDGSLLLAIYGRGLLRRWPDGRLLRLEGDPGLVTDNIRHIRVQDDRIWAASEEEGLCALSLSAPGRWRCAGLEEGLPAPGAHQSLADRQGRVWVGTNAGLAVARGADLDAFAEGLADRVPFLRLDTEAGMVSAEVNGGADNTALLAPSGRLWFATQRGAVAVDPAAFALPEAPAARLEPPQVGEAAATAPVELPADHPPLRLSWTAPTLNWARQVRFRARENGGPWRELGEARAETLLSLPPGDFTYELQASLAGNWGPTATLTGWRRPRPSERAAFPLVWVALGVLVTGGAATLRTRALREAERRLQREVDLRTAELSATAQALSDQRDRLAELAGRLATQQAQKSRLIVNTHHELRTPLTLVIGPLQALAAQLRDDPARSATLAAALRNADALQRLLDQLFDISRLDAGELPLQVSPDELVARCEALVARYQPMAAQRGIALRGPMATDPIPLWLDASLFDKALSNLLHNALKFTPSGGAVTVCVQATETTARVEVWDTGPGVPPDQRRAVFERLLQLDPGDARRHGGAGIGLALVRELVELHGGAVGVEAGEGGQGSCFWLCLPLGVAHLSLDEVQPRAPAAPAPPAPPFTQEGGPRVLIVEDHDELRAFLGEQLSARCTVALAADGPQALTLARLHPPTVLVSDVMMPGMTGIELARAFRADPALQSIPIVLLSAKTAQTDRLAGLEVANLYLTKPFSLPGLIDAVWAFAGLAAPEATPAEPAPPAGPAPESADAALLRRIEALADHGLHDEAFGVLELSRAAALSERSLRRELHRLAGLAPAAFLRERRLLRARQLLAERRFRTVGEVAAAVGMSRSYFSRVYAAWAGATPGEALGAEASTEGD